MILNKRTFFFIKAIGLLFFFLLSILSCKKEARKKQQKEQETIFAVNITKAVKGEIKNYIELNGDIKSKTEVAVYPDVMGKLKTIDVKIGDYIRGQDADNPTILAYVDPSKPGMNYKWSPVKSPITGTITDIPSQIGLAVTQQTPIIKVGKLNQIKITTYVAEKFISKIKLGLRVIVELYAYPGEVFEGKISEVSPVVDPSTRMLEVNVSLVKNDSRIKPGMFAKLKIITENKNNIVKIPTQCIVTRFGQDFVFVIDDTTKDSTIAKKQIIIKGISIDQKSEIVEGLKPHDKVVISGQNLLDNGAKVNIVKEIKSLSKNDIIQ